MGFHIKYAIDDFMEYYRSTWLLLQPPGISVPQAWMVMGRSGQNIILTRDNGSVKITYPYDLIMWDTVRMPELGYRHLRGGEFLVYFTKVPIRARPKGVNHNCIYSTAATGIDNVHPPELFTQLSVQYCRLNSTGINAEIADAIYDPAPFRTLDQALEELQSSKPIYGLALDHQYALTLGSTEEEKLILLFEQEPVGYSEDLRTFQPYKKSHEPLIRQFIPQVRLAV